MGGLDWDALSEESWRRSRLPLEGLRALVELRGTLDRLERRLAVEARRDASTWKDVGDALGISRQAACARHGPFVNATDGDSPRPFA